MRPLRPEPAKVRGGLIAAAASLVGFQPADQYVGPEGRRAGKEHYPRAQCHRHRRSEHACDAEYKECDRDRDTRRRVERKRQQYDHDISSADRCRSHDDMLAIAVEIGRARERQSGERQREGVLNQVRGFPWHLRLPGGLGH